MKKIKAAGIFILCTALIVSMTGCQKNEKEKAKETSSTNNGMGRYVEETLQFPIEITMNSGVVKQEDGSYLDFDGQNGLFVSTDKGATWNQKPADWMQQLGENTYIDESAISKSGELAIVYSPASDDGSYKPMYKYVAADGSMTDINPTSEEDNFISKFVFNNEGRLFGSDSKGKVYEVDKSTGSTTELFQAEGYIESLSAVGNDIIAICNRTSFMYDLAQKQMLESDAVLDSFLQDKTKVDEGFNSGSSAVLITEGTEENSMYLACRGGLYYHVIGGNVMEQMIDGSLSTFGNPTSYLISMIAEDDGTFLVLYSDGQLIRYSYDKTISSIPETELKVYSLKDNQTIRQAISQYQKDNPDIYVKLEVGMSGEDSVTKEDAIKTLNTEIMAGKGPDIIVFDGIPMESYLEKGMLLDITSVLKDKEKEGSLLANIAEAYKKEDKTYAIPARFCIPIVAGESSYVDKITDLASLASTVKEIRAQREEGNIIGTYTEKELLNLLAIGCAPSWVKEDGSINKSAMTDFLTYAKQIYETEKQGITPAMQQKHEEVSVSYNGQTEDLYLNGQSNAMGVLTGEQIIDCGYTKGVESDYTMITSVFTSLQKEGSIKSLNLQSQNVFLPQSIVAVNSKTENADIAKNFIGLLLSEQVQDVNLGDGFPVNKASLDKLVTSNTATGEDSDCTGMIGMSSEDGQEVTLNINKISKEQADQFQALIQNLATPNKTDSSIMDSILELGPSALNGEKSIDEVVTDIVNKVQIRLEE